MKEEQVPLGNWSVQGIYEEGATTNLAVDAEKYKMDPRAMQKTHILK